MYRASKKEVKIMCTYLESFFFSEINKYLSFNNDMQ